MSVKKIKHELKVVGDVGTGPEAEVETKPEPLVEAPRESLAEASREQSASAETEAGVTEPAPPPPPPPQPAALPMDLDDRTRKFLERAGVSDLQAEIAAGIASRELGVPMKPSNMAERIQQAVSRLSAAGAGAVVAADPASSAAPVPAPAASVAPSPAQARTLLEGSPFRRVVTQGAQGLQGQGVQGSQGQGPQGHETPAESQLRTMVAFLNRARRRPVGFALPLEEYAQRIPFVVEYRGAVREGEDILVDEYGEVLVLARAPKDAVFSLAEVRRIQMHNFALDRMLVAHVTVDDVVIAGRGPAAPYGREGGGPTAVVYKDSVVSMRIRNVTGGRIPIAVTVVAVPLIPIVE